MKNIYYLIWADTILSINKHHPNKKNWKVEAFMVITTMHAFNMWIVMLWLKYFKIFILPPIDLDIFPGDIIDGFLTFIVKFTLPFIILNYFLIFHNNRYEEIIKKYKGLKIRYGAIYSYGITLGAFFSAILYGLLTK